MYNYQKEKANIFTEDGQETFLKIRDNVQRLIKQSGAVTMERSINSVTGNTFLHMACVDRLVELHEIKEVRQDGVMGQHRIFVSFAS